MGSRLQLKYGLVSEQDRLSTSADTLLVTEPATGSKSRTKGNLYLVVSSGGVGGRVRDATALVAQLISREYYYDESAGIPICIEKCFKSANRKLRGSREASGLPPGSLGIAAAVVRTNELYVATIGNVDAYLVRAARLLMPEHAAAPGIPADDQLRVDVWRGEFAIGDSILLVSRNLTEVVGTEELKNAIVTLHPQSAVEHLHHLFVAAGGEGSDAVLALEASDMGGGRPDPRTAPITATPDPYGELQSGSPIPLAEPVAGAANAVGGGARNLAGAVTGAIGGAVDRVLDLMPRRRTSVRRISPQVSRRETTRRAAIALLAFLFVVGALGVALSVFPRGNENPVQQVSAGEAAFREAESLADQALGAGGTTPLDPAQATRLLQQAYHDLQTASTTGVSGAVIAPVMQRVTNGLDGLYHAYHAAARVTSTLAASVTNPTALQLGPDGALYYIDAGSRTITRVDLKNTNPDKNSVVVVTAGDGPGAGIGTPKLLSSGGPDLVIVDSRGGLWRWDPSDNKGNGTLRTMRLSAAATWPTDVTAIDTFLISSTTGQYYLYGASPSANQIIRLTPALDGSSFISSLPYLTTTTENVGSFLQLYIDGDVYAPVSTDVIKNEGGRLLSFSLKTPPDDGDVRPGHDYRLMTGTGDINTAGQLYVYDAKWNRVILFDKHSGAYVEQWLSTSSSPQMKDVRGMVLTVPSAPANGTAPVPTLYWITTSGLMQSKLTDVPPGSAASPSPSVAPSPSPGQTTKPSH